MAKDEFDWIAPVLGFVGLLAGSLFLSGNNNQSNNPVPPPPPNHPMLQKSTGGCGCQAKKQ